MNYFSAVIDPVYFPHLEVIGDIGNAIWQLCERIKDSPPSWDTRCLFRSLSASTRITVHHIHTSVGLITGLRLSCRTIVVSGPPVRSPVAGTFCIVILSVYAAQVLCVHCKADGQESDVGHRRLCIAYDAAALGGANQACHAGGRHRLPR